MVLESDGEACAVTEVPINLVGLPTGVWIEVSGGQIIVNKIFANGLFGACVLCQNHESYFLIDVNAL